ncbi:hypothetical protein, partial [Stenotrophomonas sp. GbtcB23]|uniref:hypothetical protein n=1 Tax=Stenotrophomonas sp. GbtcB23 TaxID=2824768 RepID=UPI001C2F7F97
MKQANHFGQMTGKVGADSVDRRCCICAQMFLDRSYPPNQLSCGRLPIIRLSGCDPSPDVTDQCAQFIRSVAAAYA